MGIVVSIAILVALLMMCFTNIYKKSKHKSGIVLAVVFVIAVGLWNAVWYGVQNVPSFWGVSALLSGVFMLFAAQIIYLEMKKSSWVQHALYFDIKLVTSMVLGLYFLLYTVTIVQINLGMPIVQ